MSSDSNQKFTHEQLTHGLEIIAVKLDTVCAICRDQAVSHGDSTTASYFHGLNQMIEAVGALADRLSGAGAVGDFPTWLCGPSFNENASTNTAGENTAP